MVADSHPSAPFRGVDTLTALSIGSTAIARTVTEHTIAIVATEGVRRQSDPAGL